MLLHAASAVILFLVLAPMTGRFWPSALVAAVFAIHPLRVESVAWVTERKDVLSGLFFTLTLAAYVNYVRHKFSLLRYAVVMVSFALALASKSTVVTLPAVLLLLGYWPLGRFADCLPCSSPPSQGRGEGSGKASSRETLLGQFRCWRPLLLEKLPLLAVAAVFSLQSLWYETVTQPVPPEDHVPLAWRTGNALVSYAIYMGQTLCPLWLVPGCPHPGVNLPIWKIIAAAVLLSFVLLGAGALAAMPLSARRLVVVPGNAVPGQRSVRVRRRISTQG